MGGEVKRTCWVCTTDIARQGVGQMSFGRPPNYSTFSVTPPDRGSFPLDHDGECRDAMRAYMQCMRTNKMDNGQCRHLSKQYLQCRMDHGLMEKDEMSNLGFHDEDLKRASSTDSSSSKPSDTPSKQARMV